MQGEGSGWFSNRNYMINNIVCSITLYKLLYNDTFVYCTTYMSVIPIYKQYLISFVISLLFYMNPNMIIIITSGITDLTL